MLKSHILYDLLVIKVPTLIDTIPAIKRSMKYEPISMKLKMLKMEHFFYRF